MSKVVNVAVRMVAARELSKITGTTVSACVDIISNTAQERNISYTKAFKQLRREVMKGKKRRGRKRGRS